MDDTIYPNLIETYDPIHTRNYLNRINFCLERNFESLIITGTGEPLINMDFLQNLACGNTQTIRPFRWIEIQTSGVTLDHNKLVFLRNTLGVTGISLSLSNMFDSESNHKTNCTPLSLQFDIDDLCKLIKSHGFNLRLSLNMWSEYDNWTFEQIFNRAGSLYPNQITFRILYTSGDKDLPQNRWIAAHRYLGEEALNKWIIKNGTPLETVSFGATRYDVKGMSVLVDQDCMSTKVKDSVRYLILRPDCHLYTKWSTRGSLLF
jgi:hypothetical protein